MKTFFFRLKQVDVAFTAAIHELQTAAEFMVVIPSDDELRARTSVGPLTAHVCRPTITAVVSRQHSLLYRLCVFL